MKNVKIAGIAIVAMLALLAALKFVQSYSGPEPLDSGGNNFPSKPAVPKQQRSFYAYQETRDYSVIAENNLFRPLGWKKEAIPPAPLSPKVELKPIVETSPPPPTYALVLTGIVQNDSEWIAVVEDRKLNEGVFLRQGEALKDTIVSEILPEHITLARGETKLQLALGKSIEYGEEEQILFDTVKTTQPSQVSSEVLRSEGSEDSARSVGTRSPISSEAREADTDNQQSLLERMRARRRRELRQ